MQELRMWFDDNSILIRVPYVYDLTNLHKLKTLYDALYWYFSQYKLISDAVFIVDLEDTESRFYTEEVDNILRLGVDSKNEFLFVIFSRLLIISDKLHERIYIDDESVAYDVYGRFYENLKDSEKHVVARVVDVMKINRLIGAYREYESFKNKNH